MAIEAIDHWVLVVKDLEADLRFLPQARSGGGLARASGRAGNPSDHPHQRDAEAKPLRRRSL